MMAGFAKNGKGSTVVLPANFNESRSMFEQMLAVQKAAENEKNAQA